MATGEEGRGISLEYQRMSSHFLAHQEEVGELMLYRWHPGLLKFVFHNLAWMMCLKILTHLTDLNAEYEP